ncbi:unnamed protein product [Brassicogethes aeneus]|uniref:TOG domain-containing protein n=1 Tax=Brassicogethes aeneus TaxID=1431903 RepID=A0A9P0FNH2_BRAAE|nr:unnamed protein product [Brassicogethes aeneus]
MSVEDYKKLSVEEKCEHHLWKVRVCGYEEAATLFRQIGEKSPEFGNFLGLVRKFVIDSNVVGQEKGLEATLAYVENYALAGKTAAEVMSGIVAKCIAAPKAKTRELALQVTLMYIEIGKQEVVMEELVKGIEQKNPKIVVACLQAVTTALREFGSKIIRVEPLLLKISTLFADRDKSVRDEAKHMVIEMYQWIGPMLKVQLGKLHTVQLAELNLEFHKIEQQNAKVSPKRFTRSHKKKQAKIATEKEKTKKDEVEQNNEEEYVVVEIDPYELAEPVDILSKLPPDFYEKVESNKWQERKEVMEVVENLLKTPKLKKGDYGDLVRAFQKIIQKDSNVVVVALGGRCMAMLAAGLKKRFQQYAVLCVPDLLEKFKEKKPNVLAAIRDAIDAVYLSTTLEAILEYLLDALRNKNPSVKLETALFLKRAISKKPTSTVSSKNLIKEITGVLLNNSNGADPALRTASKEALAYLFKLAGEKVMGPIFAELTQFSTLYSEYKAYAESLSTEKHIAQAPKPAITKPTVLVESAPVAKKKPDRPSGSATVVRSKGAKSAPKAAPKPAAERHLSDEEVDEIVSDVLSANNIGEMSDSNWKTRLAAVEKIAADLRDRDAKSVPTQAVIKVLARKPGLKDTNFQVLKARLELVKYLAENCQFSTTSAECCLNDVSDKFGDPKNGAIAAEVVTAIAECTSLPFVSNNVMNYIFSQKNPKVIQEGLLWLSNAIREFGFGNLNANKLIDNGKKALTSSNPQVRQASITLFGTMYLYMGATLNAFFDAERQSLRDQIQVEFDKYEGKKPPLPTKGDAKSASSNTLDGMDEDETEQEPEPINVQDILPRVDISSQITEALINEISDKNWKVRNEGLDKISAMLAEAKFIKPSLGELPHALAQRLTDSNIKIAQASLIICKNITIAMGPPCKQYIRTLFPGFLQGLGDSKSWMRTASLDAINAFSEQCGYKEFFEGEMIGDALKSGSPTLRNEVWIWLGEKLPIIAVKSIPKDELIICVPHLFNNVEDRNADVRKSAKAAVLGFMMHLGYDSMLKQTEKLKPGSKSAVVSALDEARPNLPVKPLPKKQAPVEEKAVRGTKPVATSKNAVKKGAAVAKPAATASSRKKDEDVDVSPLLQTNALKNQRSIDEAKLTVPKWNFTTPRGEFVDLLKDQMTTANVNRSLMANMFHSDFRYHIKALEALSEDLPANDQALIANLDLVLKWLTLRFFDTNPSVLNKGLEYLHDVFNMLTDKSYILQHGEASAIIPYIVLKMGDPSDSVRNGVNALIKQLYSIYPISRVFAHIKDGVKSKNARQRAECLDALRSIISRYGTTACFPSAAVCLKEVAKQISDRDNSVRNAALSFLVQAHKSDGDKVFQMVGNIPEKDMSLLEERIKRAQQKGPSPVTEVNVTQRRRVQTVQTVDQEENQENIAPNSRKEQVSVSPKLADKSKNRGLVGVIKDIGSTNKDVAIAAFTEMQKVLRSIKGSAFAQYEDHFVASLTEQFRNLSGEDPATNVKAFRVYKQLGFIIGLFYQNKSLVRRVSHPVLADMLSEIIDLLVSGKLEKCENGEFCTLMFNLEFNSRIIENSDRTHIACALVCLLQKSIGKGARYTELVAEFSRMVLEEMPEWGDTIDFDWLMSCLHDIIKNNGDLKKLEEVAPVQFKVVTTLIEYSIRMKGKDILNHFGKVPEVSEVKNYIYKLIMTTPLERSRPFSQFNVIMEDEEYKKLPVDEKCVHKLWKARVCGYEEVTTLFRQIDDEKSPEFSKYLGLVKKFVIDSNAMGQEKGLEATLAYVENYALAGKTVSEVMSGIVTKCIAAPRTKTRELALQVTLMYIEIEKQEAVMEELVKGMEQKNPKIVAACIQAATTALREFGSKIIQVKPLVKKITTLFADRDKSVRDEARQMVIEMYRWIGPALKTQLTNLQPVQITELEAEFGKIEGQKASPTRYIRSQQQRQAKIAAEAEEVDGVGDDEGEEDAAVEIDPYELADPVDILSKLPKDFYEKVEAKKWQERKEAMECIIQKDSNVVVVALGGRCMAMLAAGLKKRYQQYAGACVSALLEKFKEKKQNVVTALRDAIDAVYLSTTLEAILEDVLEALANKNPSVKTETSFFLSRAFSKTLPTVVNKKDASADAIGTLMKLVGEKAIGPFLVDLEKDNLKMTKIRECCEKAVITAKAPGGAKKERAPAKPAPKISTESVKAPPRTKKAAASAPAAKKKPDISSGSATVVRSKGAKSAPKAAPKPAAERHLSDEEVDEIVSDVLSANNIGEMSDSNWKTRLAAVEKIAADLRDRDAKSVPTQAVIKVLARKPGLKDTNFQVLKARLELVKYLAENCQFSTTSAECCLNDVSDKFGDPKNGAIAAEVVTAIAECTSLPFVSNNVMDYIFSQKSPKVIQEGLLWLSNAIREFGFSNLNVNMLIDNGKKALASSNPQVRQASITLFGTMYLYMGATLNVFFDAERQSLRDQIQVEFDKYEGKKPPLPSKGVVKSASSNTLDGMDEDETEQEPEPINVQDILPRVDISSQITEALINEISDKNWKVRNEGLDKISAMLAEAKFIKPSLGELPHALAQRLTDSNIKIAQASLIICKNITIAMGPPCKQYIRTLFPGFLQGLGDSKSWMRTASLDAINAFSEQCGYKEFFEGEMIGDALKSGSPTLRNEVWIWLGEKLPIIAVKSIPKDELIICVPHLFNNVEDRNADVRKSAKAAVLGFMMHLGYDSMLKQTEKLKPGSKSAVVSALDEARPNLPVKPLPKKQAPVEEKAVRGTKPVATSKNAVKKGAAVAKPAATASSRKKDEDVDLSPLLQTNALKNQRSIDEAKLKVLKWNFTTPREEFVDLLKDQMTTANVNRSLMANMFHSDFRYHIKALEALSEDLPANGQALIANLDLVLKWLTLRFFDTNPSVLLKGLEYLQCVFNMLMDTKYHMQENEASAFIPYLVLKIGDPKDSVRNGVKVLLKQISFIYNVARLFTLLMEGLKSKNARQRAECLETMGSIIEEFAACLKEVAKQISDRDNSVRNAALNCVVQAYFIVGEKVYKMVGNISDKDMSLLEERIKRSQRKIPPPKPKMDVNSAITHPAKSPPSSQTASPVRNGNTSGNHDDDDEEEDQEEEEAIPQVTLPPQIQMEPEPEVTNGPFRFDPEVMRRLDQMTEDIDRQKEIVNRNMAGLQVDFNDDTLVTHSFVRKTHHDKELNALIGDISSPNMDMAISAITEMQEFLRSNKSGAVAEHENEFMKSIVEQFKHLSREDPVVNDEALRVYRNLLTLIDAVSCFFSAAKFVQWCFFPQFYLNKTLGKKVTVPALVNLLNEMIHLLVAEKLEKCETGDAYVKVINLQCVKIIDQSDHTNIICALVQLLQESIRKDVGARHTDLVMKSIWRVLKIMSTWNDHIDYDSVLLEVHFFLKEFPSSWWKNRPSDTALRTIKTILHSSTLKLDEGKPLPAVQQSNPSPAKTSDSTKKTLSRANQAMLTDIFTKIGNKDETKDGVTLLYDFMQQHPEADIDPFLKRTNKFFQDYIKNGLNEIEDMRKNAKTSITEKANEAPENPLANLPAINNQQGRGMDYWEARLKYWNNRWDETCRKFTE